MYRYGSTCGIGLALLLAASALSFTPPALAGQPPSINSATTATGTVGTPFNYTITATNNPSSFNATPLPGGLSVNTSTGVISGTPTAAGADDVTISATNGGGTGTATLTITITAPGAPTITSATTASGTVGTLFNYTITATNSPTSFDATPLPAGLAVDTTTGAISGTPTAAGTTNVTLTATNATGPGTATLALTINAAGGGGGTFRWLTTPTSLPGTTNTGPKASTNLVYDATLLTANAAGPVTFTITAGRLPTGLMLDAFTGFITGRPTVVETVDVTFDAFDGQTHIQLAASIKTSSTGGGGNAGIGFPLPTQQADGSLSVLLPQGRVGQAYSINVTVEFGVGPFYFGAMDLPPGITMSGLEDHDATFTISGTPTAAGTFYVTLSGTDVGEGNNKILVVTPLVVLPAGSDFQFTTKILDNGEVGTPYSCTLTTNAASGVTFGASGQPVGLNMNSATGELSGTPTAPGTFMATVSASNGTDTITMNRPIIIVPAGSIFHWIFSGGLPTGTMNIPYDRTNPPLLLAADNGTGGGIVYSSQGLPEGISYDASSGALSGTATEPGLYPVVFSATDSASLAVITFNYDFVVLPPNGGDVNSLPVNLWVKKGQLKVGTDGKEAWQMQYIYNANRTAAKIFDPTKDAFIDKLGGIPELNLTPPPTLLAGTKPKYAWKSAKGVNPARAVKLDMSGQTIAVMGKNEVIPDSVPSVVTNRVTLGRKGYKLDLFFGAKGKFTPALGYRKTAFVVASAKVSVKAAKKDSAMWGMYLGDPGFRFPSDSGSKTVRFRVINSSNQEVMNKDFSAIVTATSSVDKTTGVTVYKMKSGKDSATPAGKFSYDSKSGKLAVALKGLSLAGLLTGGEAHVSVEMTIADKQYYTGVTLFAPKAGSYSTKMR